MLVEAAVLHQAPAAAPYRESRPLRLQPVRLDPPGPDEVEVDIDAVGLCHSDLSVVDGTRRRPLPMALGHEATGLVRTVGPGVTDVTEGDRVILAFVPSCGRCRECSSGRPAHCPHAAAANATGALLSGARRIHLADGSSVNHHLGVSGFATRAVVDRRSAVVVPDDLPAATAALFGCAILTGVGAVLNTAQLRAGEPVAVVGLGGVGLAAVLGARLVHADHLTVVDPSPEKRSLALELGATIALAPDEVADADILGRSDVVIEAAGRGEAIRTAWDLTAPGGRTVLAGLPNPQQALPIPATELVGQGKSLIGSYLGDSVPQRDIPRYLRLWRRGHLPVERLLSGTRPLAEINDALDDLAAARVVRTVLLPS